MSHNPPRTLVLLVDHTDQKILLGRKKYGQGVGLRNGFGGKLEEGETIIDAAVRETHEESGVLLQADQLRHCAILRFDRLAHPERNYDGYVYLADYEGDEHHETAEMFPQRRPIADIPYTQMWSDDIYRLPHILAGKQVDFSVQFDEDDQVVDYRIEVSELVIG